MCQKEFWWLNNFVMLSLREQIGDYGPCDCEIYRKKGRHGLPDVIMVASGKSGTGKAYGSCAAAGSRAATAHTLRIICCYNGAGSGLHWRYWDYIAGVYRKETVFTAMEDDA